MTMRMGRMIIRRDICWRGRRKMIRIISIRCPRLSLVRIMWNRGKITQLVSKRPKIWLFNLIYPQKAIIKRISSNNRKKSKPSLKNNHIKTTPKSPTPRKQQSKATKWNKNNNSKCGTKSSNKTLSKSNPSTTPKTNPIAKKLSRKNPGSRLS